MPTLERQALLNAANALAKYVPRDAVAVLSAGPAGELVLTATAEEGGARTAVAGAVWDGDDVSLPLAAVVQVARYSGAAELSVRDAGECVVLTGAARHTIPAPEAPDAFELDDSAAEFEPTVTVGRGVLAMLLGRIAFAKGRSEEGGVYALECVRLSTRSGRIELSATDAYQYATAAAIAECRQVVEALVPFGVMSRWASAAYVADRTELVIYSDHIVIRSDGVVAWAPTSPGKFPAAAVLTVLAPYSVGFPPELRSALALAARCDDCEVQLTVRPASVALAGPAISSQAPIPRHDGPTVTVPLDGAKLWRAVRTYAATGQPIALHYEDSERPVVLTCGESRVIQVPHIVRASTRAPAVLQAA